MIKTGLGFCSLHHVCGVCWCHANVLLKIYTPFPNLHWLILIDVISLIAETYVQTCRFDVINPHPIPGFIQLDDGKICRKPLDLMVETCHNHGFMQIFHHFPLPSGNLT